MVIPRKNTLAFTIVELIVIIVVIGILAAVGIISYAKTQQNSRDAKRSSSISVIAEALENYYQKNGEYPSCTMMSGDSDYVSKTVLSGNIAKDVLSTPTTTIGTNSIQAACADLNTASGDLFSYIGDSSANCTTGTSCSNYALKYKEENTGNIITVKSRYGNEKSFAIAWGGANADRNKSMTKTNDGGYIIAGESLSFGVGDYDVYITKYNSDDSISWCKTWGGKKEDLLSKIIQTSDGGYVIVGGSKSFSNGNSDYFIVKYNSSGSLEWNRIWGTSQNESAISVYQSSDGGYVVAGDSYSVATSRDTILTKLNKIGDISWSQAWASTGTAADWFTGDIIQTNDDGYLISGITDAYSAGQNDTYLAKYDKDGNLIWSKTYDIAGNDKPQAMIKTSDGGYLISGNQGSGTYIYIVKYNSSDSIEWAKVWNGSMADDIYDAIECSDGGFALAGYTYSYGARGADSLAVKISSSGDIIWSSIFGKPTGTSYDDAYSIVQLLDGSFVLAGDTFNYGSGLSDATVIRLNKNGFMSKCIAECIYPSVNSSVLTLTMSTRTATATSPSLTFSVNSSPSASSTTPNATNTVIIYP